MQITPDATGHEKLLTIKKFTNNLYNNSPTIALITIFGTIAAIIYSLAVTPIYESVSVLTKTSALDDQVASTSTSEIATFVRLGPKEESGQQKVAVTRALSRTYFQERIYYNSFLMECFFSVCDISNFGDVDSFYSAEKPSKSFPVGYMKFRNIFLIRPNLDLIYFVVSHKSPDVAYELLKWLIVDINNYIRDIEVQKAQSSLEFLIARLNSTQNTEIQKLIGALVQKDYQTLALSQQTDNYAFETIDKPIFPEERVFPRRSLIVTVAMGASLFFGISFFVFMSYLGIQLNSINKLNEYFLSKLR